LPCGWSKEGLQTFNALAKEVYKDRQKHDEEIDKAFKENIEQEMASNNKTGKRKRNCIDTYNDLNEQEMIKKDEEDSDEEEGCWVMENVFTV
jgi:predicted AAA+ superfamily ATPase